MTNGSSQTHTLGVITCFHATGERPPFPEKIFFEQLTQAGKKYHINIIIFNPKQIDWSTRTVKAWTHPSPNQWISSTFPLPCLIYDRCFYMDRKHYLSYKPSVVRLAEDPETRLLGRPLGGKLQTYLMLKEYPKLQPYLPSTYPVRSLQSVLSALKAWSTILLKPNGGSLGCGVISIKQTLSCYFISGRTKQNQFFQDVLFNKKQLLVWLEHFIANTRYIIQPFLKLTTPDHRPFDVRILVQKNEKHEWETTGMAVRIGNPHTVTSNLHGGGEAVPLLPFIEKLYSKEVVIKIQNQIKELTDLVPNYIEAKHGPLLELGLDLGIDPQGKVWLLEVNSKPGRSVFLKIGRHELRERAIQLPIRYAYSLLTGGKAG
ncbi:YheC/YheD family protein [Thermoflavimicrobium daqui]|uniref:YheC/YheD family protein n=1 Tax=Thermoflavimicrobium daqui TaxID=2137476 RepID=A0A364K989_9BACL|nr:YheC/YheD family protein [Thermoflavimicrobium daqui]RAL26854.1 hypothetical protein DL897_02050 [Thermoflavimicrobium daqui]